MAVIGLQFLLAVVGTVLFISMKRHIDWQQTRIDYWYELYKETRITLDKFQGGDGE